MFLVTLVSRQLPVAEVGHAHVLHGRRDLGPRHKVLGIHGTVEQVAATLGRVVEEGGLVLVLLLLGPDGHLHVGRQQRALLVGRGGRARG